VDNNRPDLLLIYSTPLSVKSDLIVKECNGIILDKIDYSIIAYGLDNIIDLTGREFIQTFDNKGDIGDGNKGEGMVHETEDGSLMRIFFYRDEWIVSTSRKIDASRVNWSSEKTFLTLVKEAVGIETIKSENKSEDESTQELQTLFNKELSKEYTYSFVLVSPDNFNVIKYTLPRLVYISRRHNVTLLEEGDNMPNFNCCLPRLLNFDQVKSNLNDCCKLEKRGVVGVYENFIYKCDYNWFRNAEKLRYNMPSLKLSYLACSYSERVQFKTLFGDENDQAMYNDIDNIVKNLTFESYKIYKESFIKKKYMVPIDHPVFYIVSRLHNLYKSRSVPISLHDVFMVMNNIPVDIMDKTLTFFSLNGFCL